MGWHGHGLGVTSPAVLRRLGAPGWVPEGALFAINPANGRYWRSSSPVTDCDATRYALNNAGVWTPFAADVSRITDRGLHVPEPMGTNSVLNSNDFANASFSAYFKKPDDLAKDAIGPDGQPNSASSFSLQYANGSGMSNRCGFRVDSSETTGTVRTVSVFVRADTPLSVRFGIDDAQYLDIPISTVWQRLEIPTAVGPSGRIWQFVVFSDGVNSGVAGSTKIYIAWGQSELAADASSYIPSGGTAGIRPAEIVTIPNVPAGTYDLNVRYHDDTTDVVEGWDHDDPVPTTLDAGKSIALAWGLAA